jgi:predicted peptidase
MAYTPNVLTSGTGYGQANNLRMAFGVSIPPLLDPYGEKLAAFIWLHGQEARGATPTSNTDYSSLHLAYNKGLSLHVRDADFPYFMIPGGVGNRYNKGSVIVVPQCSTSFTTWPFAYTAEMIKYIHNNLSGIVDVNRIYLVGYSQGGGGVLSCINDPFINANIARFVSIAAGYYLSANHSFVARSGAHLALYHTATDTVAVSTAHSDAYLNGLRAQRPEGYIDNIRFSGATAGTTNHNDIVATICDTTISGTAQFALSNGEVWRQKETLYQECFRYSLPRASRAA